MSAAPAFVIAATGFACMAVGLVVTSDVMFVAGVALVLIGITAAVWVLNDTHMRRRRRRRSTR